MTGKTTPESPTRAHIVGVDAMVRACREVLGKYVEDDAESSVELDVNRNSEAVYVLQV